MRGEERTGGVEGSGGRIEICEVGFGCSPSEEDDEDEEKEDTDSDE